MTKRDLAQNGPEWRHSPQTLQWHSSFRHKQDLLGINPRAACAYPQAKELSGLVVSWEELDTIVQLIFLSIEVSSSPVPFIA